MDWETSLIVGLILAVAGGIAVWRYEFQGPKLGLQHRMEEFAREAIKQGKKDSKLRLDFSVQSIESVDMVLLELHEHHSRNPVPEKTLSRIVLMWGAYVGSVLQKNHGGVWHTNSATAGVNTYPLVIDGLEAVPVMWALRRIRKGEAESVAAYYDKFRRQIDVDSQQVDRGSRSS